MKIGIIGGGVSGLTAAYYLHRHHEVTVFEKNSYIGGHTATKDIHYEGRDYAIDTGFIVFNDWTYPNFIALMDEIGVKSSPTSMGFSVSDLTRDYEYSGDNLNTLFAQRKNLFSLQHWRMIKDILRFNKEAVSDYENGRLVADETLGDYLIRNRYSDAFKAYYLLPMGAAIWSSSLVGMLEFPALFFVRFFHNHGLLSVNDRPTWRVINGGSSSYIEPLIEGFKDNIQMDAGVTSVSRVDDKLDVAHAGGVERFDHVIFACHSDEALALLENPSANEKSILSAIEYRENTVTLHTDRSLLPRRKAAWSSWNYLLTGEENALPVLTYDMNILQGIDAPVEFCVTLNANSRIDKEKVLGEYRYSHPVFTSDAIDAQAKWAAINEGNVGFCGAYWFNGFHEDGVKSAKRVAEGILERDL